MKKIVKYVIFFLILLTILYFVTRKKEYKHYDFPDTLNVNSNVDIEYVDTMAMIVLNKIYEIDTIDLSIIGMPSSFNHKRYDDDLHIYGFIIKNNYKDNKYIIFLSDRVYRSNIKKIISHELIHLKQMQDGKLEVMDNKYIWKKDTFYYDKINYNRRHYEIEAFKDQYKIKNKLNELLYK